MGQGYSKDIKDFRRRSKKEAKRLGFLPNKLVVQHALNKLARESKDPRSEAQIRQWDADALEPKTANLNNVFLVVDVMEARRIGKEDLTSGQYNYIAVKCEAVSIFSKTPQYAVFKEERGWRNERWIDSFHMGKFNTHGDAKFIVKIKCGWAEVQMGDKQMYDLSSASKLVNIKLNYTTNRVLLQPTWYSGPTGSCIRISIQLVEQNRLPRLNDYLPYSQWPPMVLYTNKTRLDMMLEEEEEGAETMFQGELGNKLISYNPGTLPRILGVFAGDFNRDFMLTFGLVMGAPLIDRTGTLSVAKYEFRPGEKLTDLEVIERKLNMANR